MQSNKTEKRREFIINTLYYAIVILLFYLCFKYVMKWMMPFLVGFLIALAVKPSVSGICKVTKMNRKVCACLVLIIDYALLILLIWGLGSKIFSSLRDLFTYLPTYYNESVYPFFERVNQLIIDITSKVSPDTLEQAYAMIASVSDKLREFIVNFSSKMVSALANTTAKLPFFLISFVFTILSSVFISMDYHNITAFIKRQLPPRVSVFIEDAKKHLFKTAVGYIRAYSIILVITFTELSIGLSILHIKNAIGIAAIIAIADILPVIGTGGILIPWGIISIINNNFFTGVGLLILYLIILVVRNFTEPKIVGDQLGLNPLVTLIAIYLGYSWFGVSGMILLPVTVTILVGLQRNGKIKLWLD